MLIGWCTQVLCSQHNAVRKGLMLPMTVVYKAFWVSLMGARGPPCHSIDFSD